MIKNRFSKTKALLVLVAIISLPIAIPSTATATTAKTTYQNNCTTSKMAYEIKASGSIPTNGAQNIWIKMRNSNSGNVRIKIDGNHCIEFQIQSNPNWNFVPVPIATSSLVAGKHNISVSVSRSNIYWSTLWIFSNNSQCLPNIDTVNYACKNGDTGGFRMYASGSTSTFSPKGQSVPTTRPNTTVPSTSTTTTSKPIPTTSTPSTTTPKPSCDFSKSVGVISHSIDISTSGSHRIWALIYNEKESTLRFSISDNCVDATWHSMNNGFMWMAVNDLVSVSNGSQLLRIGSSQSGVKLKRLLLLNSKYNCQPTGDGSNCPHTQTTSTTSTPSSTPTNTNAPSTTTMNHDMPGGNAADNIALEQFRNKDPRYSQYANLPSAQLPLAKLTQKASPSSSVFHPEINGRFRTSCDFSHLAYDDPIIKPGQPGKSHLHMFFGNTGTNGNSTPESIANTGGSTCSGFEANRTAYWFPTVHDTLGRARIPNGMVVYYKSEGVAMPPGGYTEMPQGLKIIAGNAMATSPQGSSYNNGWGCGNMFTNPNSSIIPNCNQSSGLMLKVHFPRCWDGSFDFDPKNPHAHVMYEVNGKCPSSHPKVFSGMTALFDWDLFPGETTAGWYLSSDRMPGMAPQPGGTTIHGDWFGGWHKDVMKSWTQNCLNISFDCSLNYLGNNGKLSGVADGGVNQLIPNFNKQDSSGPIAYTLPKRTNM